MVSIVNLVRRGGNQALDINPPAAYIDIHLTEHGSDWLWAVFAIFAVFAVVHAFIFGVSSSRTSGVRKILLPIPLFTNAIMAYAYFTYASNLGWTSTKVEFHHESTSENLNRREVFYVKYIGWFLSWPFVLFSFEVAATNIFSESNLTTSDSLLRIIKRLHSYFTKLCVTEIFVLGLLIGALINSSYRWGYFTFSLSAQLFAIFLVVTDLSRSLKDNASNLGVYIVLFEIVVWILYPVSWGLTEGGNVISPDGESVFYGILDLVTFSFVPTALTWLAISSLGSVDIGDLFGIRKANTLPRVSGETAVPSQEVNDKVEEPVNELPEHQV